MGSFHKLDFGQRFSAMGDTAEGMFERVFDKGFVRFGLNRPPLQMKSLPERLRHMPDYLTSTAFVECKGIGNDDTIKIKVVEWNCMNFWHQVHPLDLFVFSTKRFAWTIAPLRDIASLIDDGNATLSRYHDGRAYFAIPGEHFSWRELDRIDKAA